MAAEWAGAQTDADVAAAAAAAAAAADDDGVELLLAAVLRLRGIGIRSADS